jgi:UDP-2,3-diacylglucosamine pyrophosphatase LpxH
MYQQNESHPNRVSYTIAMKKPKRHIDILVLSDIHLGTYGCHARELLHYLKSIKPKIVVLNGDIIDIWQFSKSYWPKSHMKVVSHLLNWTGKGIRTYYVTGNHDEMLRKFEGLKMGALSIVNKVVLDLADGKKAWVFHGDVFDITMQHSKWLARLGAIGYDTLILINRFFNFVSEKIFHKGKLSLSKKIKSSVKYAVSFINDFEQTSADIGISNKFDFVICGHIHHPEIRTITNSEGSITYLNSGDWVENLSALEYTGGEWSIYRFKESDKAEMHLLITDENEELNNSQLFDNMLMEFNRMKQ